MKLLLVLEAAKKAAPYVKRFAKGIKDGKKLHKALFANKEDDSDTPKGKVDYVRLAGLISLGAGLIATLLAAFGKITPEQFDRIMNLLGA